MNRRLDYESMPDGALVAAAQQGDHAAFEQVFMRYAGPVRTLCLQLLSSEAEADDMTQETFVRAWSTMDRFDIDRSLWPWLYTICRRLCLDSRRRARRLQRIAHRAGLEARRTSVLEPGLDDHRHDLEHVLGALNPRYRRMLLLYANEGWSYKQLAAAEGSTVTSVAKVLARAKETLRAQLRVAPSIVAWLTAVLGARRRAYDRRLTTLTGTVAGATCVLTLAVLVVSGDQPPRVTRSPVAPRPARLINESREATERGVSGEPWGRAIAALAGRHAPSGTPPVTVTPAGPPRGVDPSGGGLSIVVRAPDGSTLFWLENVHSCADDGELTPPGSPTSVYC